MCLFLAGFLCSFAISHTGWTCSLKFSYSSILTPNSFLTLLLVIVLLPTIITRYMMQGMSHPCWQGKDYVYLSWLSCFDVSDIFFSRLLITSMIS